MAASQAAGDAAQAARMTARTSPCAVLPLPLPLLAALGCDVASLPRSALCNRLPIKDAGAFATAEQSETRARIRNSEAATSRPTGQQTTARM